MREAEERARESASREPSSEQPPKNDGKEMEVDFDVKNTGQTKTINGFDTRQVIATITVREKGKKIEDSGGIVMTVDSWLSKSAPSLKEIADFERPSLPCFRASRMRSPASAVKISAGRRFNRLRRWTP
jgi:hypothetical protein